MISVLAVVTSESEWTSLTQHTHFTHTAPLYVMIPPSSSAEILQAMGQSRPIAPKVASDL